MGQLPNFVVHLWNTPLATDGQKGGPNQIFRSGGMPPPAQAMRWMTPRVSRGTYTRDNGDPVAPRLALDGHVAVFRSSHRDLAISQDGDPCSKERRGLNPEFVGWLMGWPFGWTTLALMPPTPTAYASLETEFIRWRQRMQSELSALGLPPEVPSPQPDLFG